MTKQLLSCRIQQDVGLDGLKVRFVTVSGSSGIRVYSGRTGRTEQTDNLRSPLPWIPKQERTARSQRKSAHRTTPPHKESAIPMFRKTVPEMKLVLSEKVHPWETLIDDPIPTQLKHSSPQLNTTSVHRESSYQASVHATCT